jgi:hypothetical protein
MRNCHALPLLLEEFLLLFKGADLIAAAGLRGLWLALRTGGAVLGGGALLVGDVPGLAGATLVARSIARVMVRRMVALRRRLRVAILCAHAGVSIKSGVAAGE